MNSFASITGSCAAALLFLVPADENAPVAERGTQVSSVAWADFNGDGRPDAFVADPVSGDRLYRSLGGGLFEPATLPPAGVDGLRSRFGVWHDVDGDGLQDLYVSAASAPGRLFRNAGRGTFEEILLPKMTGKVVSAAFFDFDGDARPDLEIRGTASSALLRNEGFGSFIATALPLPPAVDPVDDGTEASLESTLGAPSTGDQPETWNQPATSGGSRTPAAGSGSPPSTSVTATSHTSTTLAQPVSPTQPMLFCTPMIENMAGGCLSASSNPALGALYPLSTALNVTAAGRVGMGTTNPSHRLHVIDSIRADGQVLAGFGSTTTPGFRFGDGTEATGFSSPAANTIAMIANGAERARITTDGKLGIGITVPSHALHVNGVVRASDRLLADWGTSVYATIRFGDGSETSGLSSPAPNSVSVITAGAERVRVNGFGNVGIGTTNASGKLSVENAPGGIYVPLVLQQKNGAVDIMEAYDEVGAKVFAVRNSGRVVTTALQITGGGDLVEGFDSGDEACEAGTVVSIDPKNPGKLVASAGSYDRRVAGVVSGANGVNHGIRMGQNDVLDGDTLVAMTGRVWVKCTTENGIIEPGDLLTTADLAGHAMKSTDTERGFGAVIGKAMSTLEEATGLVLVLVNLQ